MQKNKTDTFKMRLKSDIDITEKKYPDAYKDKIFSEYLRIFKILLMFPIQEFQHNITKSIFKFEKDEYVTFIRDAKIFLNVIGGDEQFAGEFGIDTSKIQSVLEEKIKKYETDIKNQRATSQYMIHIFHITIFKKLKSLFYGQTKQIDFMYDLYMECNYLNCRKFHEERSNEIEKEISRKSLRERIRKSQEKVFKESD